MKVACNFLLPSPSYKVLYNIPDLLFARNNNNFSAWFIKIISHYKNLGPLSYFAINQDILKELKDSKTAKLLPVNSSSLSVMQH